MREAVIVAAARTPIGRASTGSMAGCRADDLAAFAIRAALQQVPQLEWQTIDDILLGCGAPGGEQGFNMARVVGVLLGMDSVPGTTVTRYCGSSLQTTRMAFHAIRAGEGRIFVSAGVEAISRFVHGNSDRIPDTKNPLFEQAQQRSQRRSEDETPPPWISARSRGELPDVYVPMGETAENVAQVYGVSRADQDEFAFRSQMCYRAAAEAGFWMREIEPLPLPNGTKLEHDESPRPTTTLEKLAQLQPAFRPGGSVTAGNSCPLNDGAAALVVMCEETARRLQVEPLARVVATAVSAIDPEIMGMGPVQATRRVLQIAGMTLDDIDLIEINEAFAAQVIACERELDIDESRLNVQGGAIALGHPFGMTGARITGTLINSLRERDATFGLETMCVAGGQGMAMIIERLR